MSEPAKDEAALIKLIGQIIFYFGGEEDFFMENAEAALAIIRAAGWAVVPVEPTEEMRRASWEVQYQLVNAALPLPRLNEEIQRLVEDRMNSSNQQAMDRIVYAATLAAAPGVKP